jgi:hypothetical protein
MFDARPCHHSGPRIGHGSASCETAAASRSTDDDSNDAAELERAPRRAGLWSGQIVLTGAVTALVITPYTHWLIKRREHRAFERSEIAQAERELRARFDDVAVALERFELTRDYCWAAIKQCGYGVPPVPAGEKSVVEALNDRAEAFAVEVARARLVTDDLSPDISGMTRAVAAATGCARTLCLLALAHPVIDSYEGEQAVEACRDVLAEARDDFRAAAFARMRAVVYPPLRLRLRTRWFWWWPARV